MRQLGRLCTSCLERIWQLGTITENNMPNLKFTIAADWQPVMKLRNEIDILRATVIKLKNDMSSLDANKAPQKVKELGAQLSNTTVKLKEAEAEMTKYGVKVGTELKDRIYKASQSVNSLTGEIIKQKDIIRDTKNEVDRLSAKYKSMGKFDMGRNSVLNELNAAKSALSEQKYALGDLQSQQAKARLSVKSLNDEFKVLGTDSSASIGTIADQFRNLATISLAGLGIREMFSQILQVRGEFENIETSIGVLLNGNKQKADAVMSQLKQYALISPLTTKDMSAALQMMMGFGIQAEDSIKYLKAMGDISMGNTVKFNSLTLAFSQMSAAGKLMGQDLNQMINAGFNPLSIIAEKTGKSVGQLKNEMAKGAITSKMVQDAFVEATQKGGKFYGMAAAGAKTLNGQISMLQESFDLMLNDIGKKNEGLINGSISVATDVVSNYQKYAGVLETVIALYGVYKAAIIVNIALEKAQAMSRLATIQGTTTLSLATDILAGKMTILNTIMSLNPYVAMIAGLTALGVVIYSVSDHTSSFEKEMKKSKDASDSLMRSIDGQKSKIEQLTSSIQDENATNTQKEKALKQLKAIMPSVYGKYNHFIDLQNDLASATSNANSQLERQKTLLGVKMYRENQNDLGYLSKYKALLQKAAKGGGINSLSNNDRFMFNELDKYITKWFGDSVGKFSMNSVAGSSSELKYIDKRLKDIGIVSKNKATVQNSINAGPARSSAVDDITNQVSKMGKERVNSLVKMLTNTIRGKKKYAYVPGFGDASSVPLTKENLQEILNAVKDRKTVTDTPKRNFRSDALKLYNDAKKKEEKAKNGKYNSSDEQAQAIKKAEDDTKRAKANYEAQGGNVSSDTKAEKQKKIAETKAEKERVRQQKRENATAEALRKQKLDDAAALDALDKKISDASLTALQRDSNAKLIALKKAHNDEIAAIDKDEKDSLNRKIANAKALFDARGGKGKFDPSTVKLSDEETKKYDTLRQYSDEKYNNGVSDLNSVSVTNAKKAWNDYYKQFGTYAEKRKALESQLQLDLAAIDKDNAKSDDEKGADKAKITKQYQDQFDELDKNVANSASLMGQLFADSSKKSVSEIEKIIEKVELLVEYLQAAKDANGTATINGKKVTRQSILDSGVSQNTLTNLQNDPKGIQSITQGVETLKGKLGKDSPFTNLKRQITDSSKLFKKGDIAGGIKGIASGIQSFLPSVKEFGSSLGNIFGDDKLSKQISSVADGMGGLATAGQGVSQIMSGDIVGGIMGVANGASQVVDAVEGLFGADYSEYEALKSKYNELITIWDELLERKKKYINESYGPEITKATDEALALLESEKTAVKVMAEGALGSGASAGSHSIAYRMWNGSYEADGSLNKGSNNNGTHGGSVTWDDVNRAIESGIQSAGLGNATFNGMSDMLNMNSKQLEWIKTNYSGLWASMDGDFRGYLDKLIEYGDEYNDILESAKEKILGLSFDSMVSNFENALDDMGSDVDDFTDDFADKMMKSIISNEIVAKYKDQLKSLRDTWYSDATSSSSDGGSSITKKEYDSLKNSYGQIAKNAIEERDYYAKVFGWSNTSSATATKATTVSASQDSVSETNGRLTAVQEILTEGKSIADLNLAETKLISEDTRKMVIDVDGIRGILNDSYMEIQGIHRDTTELTDIIKPIQQMKQGIDDMNEKLKRL